MKNKINYCLATLALVFWARLGAAADHKPQLEPYLQNVQWSAPPVVAAKDSVVKENAPALTAKKAPKTPDDRDYTGRRIGYLGLFALGTLLSYLMVVLTIFGLFGGGAAALGILGLGLASYFLAGGLYFLVNAFSENVKPYLEMDIPQKKRERRKFLFTWLGVLILFGLVAASAGGALH